jgi:hypothetical protein
MNRQKREQLIGGSSEQRGGSERADRSQRPASPPREQVKGSESTEKRQQQQGMKRQPGRLPLPD